MPHSLPQLFRNMRTEGGNERNQGFQHLAASALLIGEFSGGHHEGRDGGVIAENLNIGTYFLYQFVQALQVLGSGFAVVYL